MKTPVLHVMEYHSLIIFTVKSYQQYFSHDFINGKGSVHVCVKYYLVNDCLIKYSNSQRRFTFLKYPTI